MSQLQFISVIALRLAADSLFAQIVALVIEFFAPRKPDFNLDQSLFEIYLKRHNGIPLGLDLALQPEDLALVQKQPSSAEGFPVKNIALLIGTDIHSLYIGLPPETET